MRPGHLALGLLLAGCAPTASTHPIASYQDLDLPFQARVGARVTLTARIPVPDGCTEIAELKVTVDAPSRQIRLTGRTQRPADASCVEALTLKTRATTFVLPAPGTYALVTDPPSTEQHRIEALP